MRIKLYITSAIVLFSVVILAALQYSTVHEGPGTQGFNRHFKPGHTERLQTIKSPVPLYAIAGIVNGKIYFTTSDPNLLLLLDSQDGSFDSSKLRLPRNEKFSSNFSTIVDSGIAYIFGGNIQQVFLYNFNDSQSTAVPLKSNFSKAIVLPDRSFLFKGFDSTGLNKIFIKREKTGNFKEAPYLTDQTNDGGLLTDGVISYDVETNTVVFTHFFSNKIVCFDTSLSLVRRFSSIDTCSSFQASTIQKRHGSKRGFTFSSPPRIVNRVSRCFDGALYVNSRIIADNENANVNTANSVIDIYNIKTGKYVNSFYIPNSNGKRISDFTIIAPDTVLALFGSEVTSYRIPQ